MLPLRYRATSYNKKSIICQFFIGVGLSLGIWGFGFALGRKRTLVVGSVHGNRLSFFSWNLTSAFLVLPLGFYE